MLLSAGHNRDKADTVVLPQGGVEIPDQPGVVRYFNVAVGRNIQTVIFIHPGEEFCQCPSGKIELAGATGKVSLEFADRCQFDLQSPSPVVLNFSHPLPENRCLHYVVVPI